MNAPQSRSNHPEPFGGSQADVEDENAVVISIYDAAWLGACHGAELFCRDAVQAVMEISNIKANVTIVLANDARMRALNYRFRGRNQPTNVLAFPAAQKHINDDAWTLGDVVLGLETLKTECQQYDRSLGEHLKHLVVHGCLHLLGFDHKTDAEAIRMEKLETTILNRLGVPDPYREEQEVIQ
ncbi:MAG: rRNA maturation RNase YbeY [Rhodospirillaceae bacterium]|nr:rRNA maturation RNase YbeY [Rhodospirillaceae bacterium]|tara:strand:+ start:117 stop:665 length:549 start_codon:yes stop_codon:yes gene_type:complete